MTSFKAVMKFKKGGTKQPQIGDLSNLEPAEAPANPTTPPLQEPQVAVMLETAVKEVEEAAESPTAQQIHDLVDEPFGANGKDFSMSEVLFANNNNATDLLNVP